MVFDDKFEKNINQGEEKQVNRRTFIKGSAATVALAAGTTMFGANLGRAEAGEIEVWDAEADVVVLGYGCAGAGAALAAHDAGASVLVLEATAVPGGTTRTSGGIAWIPGNSLEKALGISDPEDKARTYLEHLAGGQADAELIDAFLLEGPKVIDYIQNNTGVKWNVNTYSDYHPEWPGGLRRGRSLGAEYNGKFRGEGLMAGLYDAAIARKIPFAFNAKAKKLIVNSQGRVVGVQALQGNRGINVRANKGVVIATGGFEWDETLRKHYLRGPHFAPVNLPPGDGDGLKMAMAVGADLRNMNESWGLLVYQLPGWEEEVAAYDPKNYKGKTWDKVVPDWFTWRGKPGIIIVNKEGKRFCNEASDYDSVQYAFLAKRTWGDDDWINLPAFVVADSTEWKKWAFAGLTPGSEPPAYVSKANTLAELAKTLGLDAAGLEETVSTFNKYASEKVPRDPLFHRGESYFDRFLSGDAAISRENPEDPAATLAPLKTPPYYAMPIYPASCGTCGGPRVNRLSQVINVFGQVIGGLYAAGNAAGIGAPGRSYGGPGGTIGPGLTFGYIAGKAAAADAPSGY